MNTTIPPPAVPPGILPLPAGGSPEGPRERDSTVVMRVGVDDAPAAAVAVRTAIAVWVAGGGVDVAVPTGVVVFSAVDVDTAVAVPADGVAVPERDVGVPLPGVWVAAACVVVAVGVTTTGVPGVLIGVGDGCSGTGRSHVLPLRPKTNCRSLMSMSSSGAMFGSRSCERS